MTKLENKHLIGTPIRRVDARDKVTGAAIFGADLNQPGQLYGATYRSPYPHARILSIDTLAAAAVPGVRAVVVGADLPIRYGAVIQDEPFLALDKVRYFGEPVAAVAADTLEIAQEAARLITAEYELLPVVTDPVAALREGAPLVHESWDGYKKAKVKCIEGGNQCDKFQVRKGDIEEGFRQADVIVENEYETGIIQHVTIETHMATVMVAPDKKVTCWTSSQSPFVVRNYFLSTLGLATDDVRVVNTYVGGGFGCKYDLRAEMIAYMLAAKVPNRPVKVVYDRTEDLIGSVTRGSTRVHIKTGATKQGDIVAQQIEIYWDTGAYATMGPRVAQNGAIAASGPYEIPNIKIDSYCVVTNKPICGAYRGFGVPETNWACENQMNALAAKIGMDPLELRLRNGLYEGAISVTGEKLFSVGLKPCLNEIKKKMAWDQSPLFQVLPNGKLRGKGVACFWKMTSSPSNTSVIIKLNEDGTAVILAGGSEMGQGSHTVVSQIVAEELGIPLTNIKVPPLVDTQYTPFDKTTTSSRYTFMMGNALLVACNDIKQQLVERAAISWHIPASAITVESDVIKEEEGEERSFCIKDFGKTPGLIKEMPPILGRGYFSTAPNHVAADPETAQSPRPTAFWIYGAQAAEVEIDPETGDVDILKFVAAHDCGKVLNTHTARQQVEGAIVMGLGHALREELIYQDGYPQNANMVDYCIPTVADFDINAEVSFVDAPHMEGPYGAKGVGETALTATCGAVGMAVSNAVGRQFHKIPITAEQIFMALDQKD